MCQVHAHLGSATSYPGSKICQSTSSAMISASDASCQIASAWALGRDCGGRTARMPLANSPDCSVCRASFEGESFLQVSRDVYADLNSNQREGNLVSDRVSLQLNPQGSSSGELDPS